MQVQKKAVVVVEYPVFSFLRKEGKGEKPVVVGKIVIPTFVDKLGAPGRRRKADRW